MNDWSLWLNSNETRAAIKLIKEAAEELRELITDGSHILEKDTGKIALDYTYSLGQLDGMKTVIDMIVNIKELTEEEKEQ